MFVGYGRSGHSLVGQLINAHRNAVIAHEAHALVYLKLGYSWRQIYAHILRQDEEFEARDRQWTGYKYRVPDLSQGEYADLKVIGDKKGGGTTDILEEHPELFARLNEFNAPLRVIHHVRNPYDNISSIARREDLTPEEATQKYFRWVAYVREHLERIQSMPGARTLETHHESLIENPEGFLIRICQFLELTQYPTYLEGCADQVFDAPHQSRHKVHWADDLKHSVARRAQQYDFLRDYRF